ncbi:MAG: transglycosylase SLT domain-containing protein [Pseudomonadota bacterium]
MKWAQIVICTTVIGGCAMLPAETPAPEPAPAPTPAETAPVAPPETPAIVNEIYVDLDSAVSAYQDGMALFEQGSVTAAEEVVADAMQRIDDAADRCRLAAGCDLGRALSAYQAVLAYESSVFDTGEPGDVEPGEGPSTTLAGQGGRSLDGVDLAELIQLNRYVKDAMHDWLTWNRPLLIKTWENYQFVRPLMLPAYDDAELPEALLFGIMAVESQGRVHSYSRAGAAGPMQFMRATARRYGLKDTNGFDERLDPAKAAKASVDYLNDQYQRLDQSLEKTLAAYNAGENRLARLNRHYRGADFWTSDFFYSLPRDTRRYVPQVLAAAWLFLHPEEHGLYWPSYEGEIGPLELTSDISLSEISICLGNAEIANGWFRALRNLNPDLNPGERQPAGTSIDVPLQVAELYPERCSDPTVLALAGDLRDASESRESDLIPYLVRQGDTLGLIASRYRCMSLKELAALNNISPPRYLIRAGKTLQVPNC